MTLDALLRMTQSEILAEALALPGAHQPNAGTVIVPGTVPLALVAHMDTVYPVQPSRIVTRGHHVSTPIGSRAGIGGDDRCGCYVLFEASTWEFRPTLVFCSDEETLRGSSVGLDALDWSDHKAVIEVDGPGYGVYYTDGCSNATLDDYLADEIGLVALDTSYNDVQEICTPGNPPGVTLGAAYYNQHDASREWINVYGLGVVVEEVRQIVAALPRLAWSVVPEPRPRAVGSGWDIYGSSRYDYGAPVGALAAACAVDDYGDDEPDYRAAVGCREAAGECPRCEYADECEALATLEVVPAED